jgi:hypothetical protein
MRRVSHLLSLFAVVAPVCLLPATAGAQEDLSLRVIPRFGLLNPGSSFYEEFVSFAEDTPTEWTTGSLGRAAYVGLAVEMGLDGRGVSLRGEIGHSFEGWLSAVHGYVQPRILFEPPAIINTWIDVPAALTFATAQIILPTRLDLWGLQPYFLLGAGGKWYHFGEPTEAPPTDAILPSDGFTVSADFGGGINVEVLGLTFDFQVRDTLNRYWGNNQNDLIFSGAWVWQVR